MNYQATVEHLHHLRLDGNLSTDQLALLASGNFIRQAQNLLATGATGCGTYVKLLNQPEKIPLIILDDFGLQPLDQNLRLALRQILEDRYGKRPILVAS